MAVFSGIVFFKKSDLDPHQTESRLELFNLFAFYRDADFALESFNQRRFARLSHSAVFILGGLALIPDGMRWLQEKIDHATG